MIIVDFLEILGCALVAFAIVITLFEKGGKHEQHQIRV